MSCNRLLVVLIVALCSSAGFAADGKWIDAGKGATVLVDLGEAGSGSGFCVDASGLFVTNRHVIVSLPAGGKVKVIVNPSESTQRSLDAVVVARSAKYDLAVLRVAEPGTIKPLALGDDSAVSETDTVTAFGYPFGKMLASKQGEYPGVSVNTGKVTSLRREGGKLSRLQIDAAVNPGNSGGPVLDAKGRVIGVVVSGIRMGGQSGVNFAIPVSQLKEFLKPAYVALAAPQVPYSNRHEEAQFVASVFQFGHDAMDVSVELTLQSPGAAEKKITLARQDDGTYTGTTAAVPEPADKSLLAVTALTDRGLLRGWARDGEVGIGEQTVKLSEVKTLQRLGTGKATMLDGRELTGAVAITGGMRVTADDGVADAQVNFSDAVMLRTDDPVAPDSTVKYTLTAKRAGASLGESSGKFSFTGVPGEAPAPDESADEPEPETGKTKTVTLPLTPDIDDAFTGGGGRFQVVHLHGLRTYAIIDLTVDRIVGWVPVETDEPAAAAGKSELIVATVDHRQLMRFDLATGKSLGTFGLGRALELTHLEMGNDSDGPLAAKTSAGENVLFEVPSFREIPPVWANGVMSWSTGRISPDGSTLVGLRPNGIASELFRVQLDGDKVTGRRVLWPSAAPTPNYNGSAVFAVQQVFDHQLRPIAGENQMITAFPTQCMGINLGATFNVSESGMGLSMVMVNSADRQPLCPLPAMNAPLNGIGDMPDGNDKRAALDFDRRLMLDPAGGRASLVPPTDDRVVIHHFQLDDLLKTGGGDWMLVVSDPPTTFTPGQPYTYAVDVRSSHKVVAYKLAMSPAGMTIGSDGKIAWAAAATSDQIPVTIEATDSAGKVARQSYFLRSKTPRSNPSDESPTGKLLAMPMETLTEVQAKTVGDSLAAMAAAAHTPAAVQQFSRRAAQYYMLYLSAHRTDDADRQAVVARLAPPAVIDQTDVMARIVKNTFVVWGKWTPDGTGIKVASGKSHPRVCTFTHCRGSYRFEVEFTPASSKGESDVTFHTGIGAMAVSFGGWKGCIGLVDIKGHGFKEDRIEKRPWKPEAGRRYTADIYVVLDGPDARVAVDLDDKPVLQYTGPQKELSVQTNSWQMPGYNGIGLANDETAVTFHTATLSPIDAAVSPTPFGVARDFQVTKVAELTPPAGATASAGNVTVKGTSLVLPVAKQFDRLTGAVKSPGGGCTISCDGTVKWRSAAKPGDDQRFDIDLSDVQKVELSAADAATWVDPRLLETAEPALAAKSPIFAATAPGKRGIKSEYVGGNGGKEFSEIFPDGGILTGFNVSFLLANNDWYVRSLQAIYMTPDGDYHVGTVHGIVGNEADELMAPAGYAIGSVDAIGGGLLDGFSLSFQRLTPDGLDDSGLNMSDGWHGKQRDNGGERTKLGVKGRPIIGLCGRSGDGIDALGVITAP